MHRCRIIVLWPLLLLLTAAGAELWHPAEAVASPRVPMTDSTTLLAAGSGPARLEVRRLAVGSVTVEQARVVRSGAGAARRLRIEGRVAWGRTPVRVVGAARLEGSVVVASLQLRSELPVGPGVRLAGGRLQVRGGASTLAGRVGLLGGPTGAPARGPVRFGARPTYDLRTDAESFAGLGDGADTGFGAGTRLRSGAAGGVVVDAPVRAVGRTHRLAGSFRRRGRSVVAALAAPTRDAGSPQLSLTIDEADGTVHGSLSLGDTTFGPLHVRSAVVRLDVVDGHLEVGLTGRGDLGQGVTVELDAGVALRSDGLTLSVRGFVSLLDRFTDVGATGMISVGYSPATIRYDLTLSAATALDFTGSRDLFLRGGVRLHGTVGQPVGIDADLRALGNDVRTTGTLAADGAGARLHLTERPGGTTSVLVDLAVSRSAVTGRIRLGVARLDRYTVSDATLDVSIDAASNLSVAIGATIDLRGGAPVAGGIAEARGSFAARFSRLAGGASDLVAQVRLDRLRTVGDPLVGTVAALGLDYLDVSAELPDGGNGTVGFAATLAAARRPDGTFVLPDRRGMDGGARIDVVGTLELVDGRIARWTTDAQVARLQVGELTIAASFRGSGDARRGTAATVVSGDVVAAGGRIRGHLEGPVGYEPAGGLRLGLRGTLDLVDVGGLYAHVTGEMRDNRVLTVGGTLAFGGFGGHIEGEVGVRSGADGIDWPIVDLRLRALHHSTIHSSGEGLEAWWEDDAAEVLLGVTLDNRTVPTRFDLRAGALGQVFPTIAPGFWDSKLEALGALTASGHLELVDGSPGFELDVRASGTAGIDLLGVFHLGAEAAARVHLRGNDQHVAAEARGVVLPRLQLAGLPIGAGVGTVDVWFAGSPADQRFTFGGVARAGAHILGPLVSADAEVSFGGESDGVSKRARIDFGGAAHAQAFAVLARGSASGWLSIDVDFASAEPFITGTGHLAYDAHFLLFQLAGFSADLRFDGTTLWVDGGTKLLNEAYLDCDAFTAWVQDPDTDPAQLLDAAGNAIVCVASAVRTTAQVLFPFVFPSHQVVDLHGTLFPVENLCGDRQRSGPFTLWNWVADGSYGTCGGAATAARGRVLVDSDRSGGPSAGDVGLADVPVDLLDAAGDPLGRRAVTDGSGSWRFEDLVPGQVYRAAVRVPAGLRVVSAPDRGTDEVVPLLAVRGELVEVGSIVLGPPADPTDPTGTGVGLLTGLVVDDAGGDGSAVGDAGFADVLVHVSGPISTTVRTGADGRWVVRGLPPGAYQVTVERPTYAVTVDPDGTADGTTTATVSAGGITVVGPFGLQLEAPPADPGAAPTEPPAPRG